MTTVETTVLVTAVHAGLLRRGATIAVAESLTGGLLGAALTGPAGSSATFRGGVVAYATELKAALLDVDAALLLRDGAVSPRVAAAMARGATGRLQATYGLAVTGVAGPDPQDGRPPGEVHVALAGPGTGSPGTGNPGTGSVGVVVRSLELAGGRDEVRAGSVLGALVLAAEVIGKPAP